MKKGFIAMLAVTSMAFGLIGCGGKSSESTNSINTTKTTQEEASESSAQLSTETQTDNSGTAVEISLWHYFDSSADAKAIVDKCDEYNKLQNKIYITPTYVSRQELMNQYTIGAISGELPDIGMVDSPDMASYIALGVFEDVSDSLGKWNELDKFYPGPLSSCMDADGKLYGLPQNSNCLALAVNMDLLKAAGYDKVPTSIDELQQMVKATTDPANSVYGFAMSCISTEEGTFQLLPWIVATHDGVKSSLTDLTNPNAAIGLDLLKDFVQAGYMSSECVNWTQADAYNQFCAGKAAMAEIGTWHLATMANDVKGSFSYEICLLPTGDAGTSSSTIGGENFGICSGAKNVEDCVEFFKWFMGQEQEALWAVQAGKLPVRSDSIANYNYEQDAFKVFQEEMNYALARGPHAEWPTISVALYTAAQSSFLNGTPATDSLKEAASKINPILAKNPLPVQ